MVSSSSLQESAVQAVADTAAWLEAAAAGVACKEAQYKQQQKQQLGWEAAAAAAAAAPGAQIQSVTLHWLKLQDATNFCHVHAEKMPLSNEEGAWCLSWVLQPVHLYSHVLLYYILLF
jgi:hypothetical protein